MHQPGQLNNFLGFPPEALKFLSDLKKHNNRAWFAAHRAVYEEKLKQPLAEAVLHLGRSFRRFAPELVADPRVSIYRIYRDTRFSRDKSPYKTQAAAVFPVRGLPKNLGPALYFHITPDEVLLGGGMYMPDAPLLRAVRDRIAAHPRRFASVVEGASFRKAFGELAGETLKTAPKGFSPDHPVAHYLRYKQFLFFKRFPASLATGKKFIPMLEKYYRTGMPLIRFLADAAHGISQAKTEAASFNCTNPLA
ncbi:MAG: hypothetical protein A3F68_01570 [Acidobacteria bacterium RIFCSPLOWO2_12_FULL_54_10]|nr:MAG: hypothetical protein A3F68_01570 [Acidobacteria bacterium RIFCSPLOWO2_12_FULL_54_10]